MNELDNCPFCKSDDVEINHHAGATFVDCLNCNASGPIVPVGDNDKAVELWNNASRGEE